MTKKDGKEKKKLKEIEEVDADAIEKLKEELEKAEEDESEGKEAKEKKETKAHKEKKEKDKEKKHAEPKKKAVEVNAKFILDDKGEAHVLLEGCDLGYANLLVEKLLGDKNVDFAAVDYVHPTQRIPLLKIKGKGGIKKLVSSALKEVEKEIKTLSL